MTGTIEEIYRTHRNGLFTLALSITRHADSAEDAVHDAVVRLCRAGRQPSGDPVAYVFAAVRNAAIDQKRRAMRGQLVSIFDVAEAVSTGSPGARLQHDEQTALVDSAIASLPDEQREAVIMHLYTGLTFAQSAEVLGVPLQTLAARYRRGLEKLRQQLIDLKFQS